jgi:hypothetical protein
MAIESTCQGCGKTLRVGDEHAGKNARCPHCQSIYIVPAASPAYSPSSFAASSYPTSANPAAAYSAAAGTVFPTAMKKSKPEGRWTMKTPDGVMFGPVPRSELDRWRAEGRITPQSQLQQEGSDQWLWAGQVYSELQSFAADSPFAAGYGSPAANPFAPGSGGAYNWPSYGGRYREQHRGGAILTMSIVGLILCQFIALASLIMAIIDLGKMRSGTMDPAGRGLTIAGLVVSIVSMVLWVLMMVLQFGLLAQ